jgi:hypothetical protein
VKAGERGQPGEPEGDAEDRGEDRHPGREQRPQRDREDDEGDDDPHRLGVRLGLVEDDAATEVDLQSGRAGRVGTRLELVGGRVGDLVGGHRIDHVGEGDPPVLGDRAVLERVGDGVDVLGLRGGGERLGDRGLVLGLGQGLAGRRLEHHPSGGAAGSRELLLEQVLSRLRLGPRDRELVVGLPGERRRAGGDGGQHEDPPDQHLPAVVEGPSAEPMQIRSHPGTLL